MYVSPDYYSGDDRDIVFLCSTDCYAYYNDLLVHETSAYARLDNIVQKRKAAERAASKVRKLIINPKKFSEEEAEKISDKVIDRIKDICGIYVDNNDE